MLIRIIAAGALATFALSGSAFAAAKTTRTIATSTTVVTPKTNVLTPTTTIRRGGATRAIPVEPVRTYPTGSYQLGR